LLPLPFDPAKHGFRTQDFLAKPQLHNQVEDVLERIELRALDTDLVDNINLVINCVHKCDEQVMEFLYRLFQDLLFLRRFHVTLHQVALVRRSGICQHGSNDARCKLLVRLTVLMLDRSHVHFDNITRGLVCKNFADHFVASLSKLLIGILIFEVVIVFRVLEV
jgi:hypothetical protein